MLIQEEFIEKAKKIHGDKYDYSKVDFIDTFTEVCIICPKHGEFWQKPNNHLKGYGCKQCGIEKNSEKYRLTLDAFIEKARRVHGDKYDYSKCEYANNHTKMCIICPEHGEFWQTSNDHLDKHGCPKCRDVKTQKRFLGTTNNFIEKARKVHGDKYDYSKVEYINTETKVCIICPEHGEFWQTPHSHLHGNGCHVCGSISRGNYHRLTNQEFIEKAKSVHGDRYDYSKVEYRDTYYKVCIICPEHGEFWQRPNDHLDGHGCPSCSNSTLEKHVRDLLEENNINFIAQYYPKFLLNGKSHKSLDFYLPDYNIAIECQGEQHFKPVNFGGCDEDISKNNYKKQIERDIDKYNRCIVNNIKIIYYANCKYTNYLYNIIYNDNELLNEIKNEKK